ncbi:FadR/GntR family transcriptional regulator [Leifsonia sp. fls2-241-R2A-40a]|uniref:FadR/GntR family transcriptional regulator n=1 Tax=Leifsonia sp. fls2-241-R2A-40a TaxID=3040290 RepID=UPI00254BD660|nr:FadR/GntR family transcriptional regulator [Leifsonia sp. fls2-241-R2A-40a]
MSTGAFDVSLSRAGTLHAQVVNVLGLKIAGGTFPSGATLPAEPVLCDALGVSRGALREAVKALAAKGMLEPRPRTGTAVVPRERWNLLDRDVLTWLAASDRDALIGHLTEMRRLVEPGSAALAAERATGAEAAELLSAYRTMAVAGETGTVDAYADADVRFHQVLSRISHNPMLAALSASWDVALHTSFETTSGAEGAIAASLPIHAGIAEAVAHRDADRAAVLALELVDASAANLSAVRRQEGTL